MRASHVYGLAQARQRHAQALLIELSVDDFSTDLLSSVKTIMREDFQFGGRGNCPLWIRYRGEEASTDIKLGHDWQVVPSDGLIEKLKDLCGESQVSLLYPEANPYA